MSAAKLPTAFIVGWVAGSAPLASRPFGPDGAALRAGLDPGSVVTASARRHFACTTTCNACGTS